MGEGQEVTTTRAPRGVGVPSRSLVVDLRSGEFPLSPPTDAELPSRPPLSWRCGTWVRETGVGAETGVVETVRTVRVGSLVVTCDKGQPRLPSAGHGPRLGGTADVDALMCVHV